MSHLEWQLALEVERLCEERMELKQEVYRLRLAADQALSTLVWAEREVPGTNLQSDIILLRWALGVDE